MRKLRHCGGGGKNGRHLYERMDARAGGTGVSMECQWMYNGRVNSQDWRWSGWAAGALASGLTLFVVWMRVKSCGSQYDER